MGLLGGLYHSLMWKEVVVSGTTWRLVSFFDVEGGSCQWDYLEVSIILSSALFSIILTVFKYRIFQSRQ